jgi:hypothetical protein
MEVDVLLDQGGSDGYRARPRAAGDASGGRPAPRGPRSRRPRRGGRRGREVRHVVRAKGLEAAARSMATVAARCDQRVIVIERVAESAAREQSKPEKNKEVWQ